MEWKEVTYRLLLVSITLGAIIWLAAIRPGALLVEVGAVVGAAALILDKMRA